MKNMSKNIASYIPLCLELFESAEFSGNGLIGQQRVVLPQRPLAYLCIFRLWYGILYKGLFQLVEGYYNTEKFGEGILQVALCSRARQGHFLSDDVLC